MKKVYVVFIIIFLLLATAGIVFWQYTTTPRYSLLQIKKAYDQHDFSSFEKYVDIETVTNSLVNQFLDKFLEANRTKDKEEVIGQSFYKGLVEFLKPKLNTIAKDQITDIIETGKFEEQIKKEDSKDKESSSSNKLDRSDNVKNIFQGIEYEKKEGKICYVGLKILNEKTNSTSTIDIKMRDKGGYWQVVEVLDILKFAETFDGSSSKFFNVLNEIGVNKDNIKKESDPDGSLKIDTLDVNSKFLLNVKEGKLFVITGRVKNGYSDARSFIKINGKLYKKGKILSQTETVFCGNVLSDIELSNMELEAIKKRLSNRFGDNKSNMQIKPGGEIPFMIVFSNLPDDLEEFSIVVKSSSPVSHKTQY